MSMAHEQKASIGAPPNEVNIVAHSMLFYWWPVWVFGLLMAGLTWLDGHRLAIVPAGTHVEGFDGGRESLVLPAGAHLPLDPATGKPKEPTIHVAATPATAFSLSSCCSSSSSSPTCLSAASGPWS